MSRGSVEIRRAKRERVPALAAMLARAFADDPMIAVSIAPEGREERLRRFFTLIDEDWADLGVLYEGRRARRRGVAPAGDTARIWRIRTPRSRRSSTPCRPTAA